MSYIFDKEKDCTNHPKSFIDVIIIYKTFVKMYTYGIVYFSGKPLKLHYPRGCLFILFYKKIFICISDSIYF